MENGPTIPPAKVISYFERTTGYQLSKIKRRHGMPRRGPHSIETARKILSVLLYKFTWLSTTEIAKIIGYACHSSVLYAKKTTSRHPVVKNATRKEVASG